MKMFSDSPCQLNFRLLATRRFVLDNECVISEFVPGAVLRQSLQNRVMPYCKAPPSVTLANGVATLSASSDAPAEGVLFVGGFFPGVHFSADFEALSPGAAALLEMAPPDGSLRLRVRAVPGCPVEFTETRQNGHSSPDLGPQTLDFGLSMGASAPRARRRLAGNRKPRPLDGEHLPHPRPHGALQLSAPLLQPSLWLDPRLRLRRCQHRRHRRRDHPRQEMFTNDKYQ